MTDSPKLYYDDAVRKAVYGMTDVDGNFKIGDGTYYATGSTASIDADNNKITLDSVSNYIADVTDADDLWNGYAIHFTDTNAVYFIQDYDQSTTTITITDKPSSNDTGPWRIIFNAYSSTGYSTNIDPTYLCNGILSSKFTTAVENIQFAMPNIIVDGGFEQYDIADASSAWNSHDSMICTTTYANRTGYRAVRPDEPGQTDGYLEQELDWTFEKNKQYNISMRINKGTNVTTGAVQVKIQNVSGDTDNLLNWTPELSDSSVYTTTFTPSKTEGQKKIKIYYFHVYDPDSTNVYIDEVYLWESLSLDTVFLGNYNIFDYQAGDKWEGNSRPIVRSNVSSYGATLANLSNATYDNRNYAYVSTSTSVDYPYHTISMYTTSSYSQSIGCIFIGKKWDWSENASAPNDLNKESAVYDSNETRGGVRYDNLNYAYKEAEGTLFPVQDSEASNFKTWWDIDGKHRNPMWFQSTSGSEPYYCISLLETFSRVYNPILREINFHFREIK